MSDKMLDLFEQEIKNIDTRYFIFDSKGTKQGNKHNIDFSRYGWNTSRFNKIREGDLFLYRRPVSASEFKKFYFFGAGKVEKIEKADGKNVVGIITKPLIFEKILLQMDLESFKWKFKARNSDNWKNFFNQGGVSEISKNDFIGIIEKAYNSTK